MKRWKIITATILLAVLVVLAPFAVMFYASWDLARHQEQAGVEQLAQRALARADAAYRDAQGVLLLADSLPGSRCSEEHVAQMKLLALNAQAIDGLGYFGADGLLKCTSWNPRIEQEVHHYPVDFSTPDGIQVAQRVHPTVAPGRSLLALSHGDYAVLLDPARIADVVLPAGGRTAIVSNANGQVVAQQGALDHASVARLLSADAPAADDTALHAVARNALWTALVSTPRTVVFGRLARDQLWTFPLALLLAAGLVGSVLYWSRRQLSPLQDLRQAIKRREFIVHYQPIVRLQDSRCIGGEALVRWRRADGELVAPDRFIPLAEQSGMIGAITEQVVEQVVAEIGPTLVADPTLHLSINLSALDLCDLRLLEQLQARLAGAGIQPRQVWLEATERGFMNLEAAQRVLTQARQHGHFVAIDDFGTGYSSLQYLQSLPVDALKIDRSFVAALCQEIATSPVTQHIIGMARALRLATIAEGIETQEQANYLRREQVQYAQGWLFSRALPAADFLAYLGRHSSAAA